MRWACIAGTAQQLNDKVINAYLSMLAEWDLANNGQRSWLCNTHFWPKLSGVQGFKQTSNAPHAGGGGGGGAATAAADSVVGFLEPAGVAERIKASRLTRWFKKANRDATTLKLIVVPIHVAEHWVCGVAYVKAGKAGKAGKASRGYAIWDSTPEWTMQYHPTIGHKFQVVRWALSFFFIFFLFLFFSLSLSLYVLLSTFFFWCVLYFFG